MNDKLSVAGEIETFELVQKIFFTGLEIVSEPGEEVKKNEKVIGIIKDSATRSFFSYLSDIHMLIGKNKKDYDSARAQKSDKVSLYEGELGKLLKKDYLFRGLFWQGVYSAFPICGMDCGIRKGWQVVSFESGNVPGRELFADIHHPARTFFKDIGRAILATDEKGLSSANLELEPVNIGDEEYIIGEVSEPFLKALFFVMNGLERADRIDELASSNPIPFSTIQEAIFDVCAKKSCLAHLHNLAQDLFWLGVLKSIHMSQKFTSLGVRAGWKIVYCPPLLEDGWVGNMRLPVN